jgi:hypothetical protein
MKLKFFALALLCCTISWSQQLEFQYSNQQLNVYNSLTSDISLFTQNFDDQVSAAIPFRLFIKPLFLAVI